MSVSVSNVGSVDQATILGWMNALHESARSAPWFELLDFRGVDAFDALLAPLYMAVLNGIRNQSSGRAISPGKLIAPVRNWAYWLRASLRERRAARASAAAGPTDVLFWSRASTHTDIMHPVSVALATQGDTSRMIACHPAIFETVRQVASDPAYTMGLWPSILYEARREGAQRARRIARAGAWGCDGDVLRSAPAVVTPAVRRTLLEFLPLVSETVASVHAALDAFRPKVLVVGNDLTVEGRVGCRVAAARGVPTAMFTHGAVSADAIERLHCVDRLLVYNNRQRQMYAQLGYTPDRIVTCGAPNLDRRPRQSGAIHPQLQQRFGLESGQPWILVATSGPGHRISYRHHQQVVEHLDRLHRAMPDVPLVVKLHPKDHARYYEAALRNRVSGKFIVVGGSTPGLPSDIFDWLQGCGLVLTGASAVAFEAMFMDVPVITMDFCEEIRDVDFIDAGATVHVRTGDDLVAEARSILAARGTSAAVQARVRSYLEETFYSPDGRASQRGAEAIHAMFRQSTS